MFLLRLAHYHLNQFEVRVLTSFFLIKPNRNVQTKYITKLLSLHVCFSKENSQCWKATNVIYFQENEKMEPQILKNNHFQHAFHASLEKTGGEKELRGEPYSPCMLKTPADVSESLVT